MAKARYFGVSILLLLPVFWQSRIQAGDLSSHVYNAWLAQLIAAGRVQGLTLATQTTNVLFDLILGGLFRLFGAGAAQRIAVSVAVLVFVWGAFRFVSVVADRAAWHILPCIAMLAYGWVYHMGFFNFYLSMGLCFWALAAAWNPRPRRVALAAALLAIAYLAHGLPVIWSSGLLAYQWLSRRIPERARAYLTASYLFAIVLLKIAVSRFMITRWSILQGKHITGADQLWVFDSKYYFVLLALIVAWSMLFYRLWEERGASWVVGSVPFQLCVICGAAILVLPGTILFPGFKHTLVYIAERMSLGVGVCVCALLAAARPGMFQRGFLALVTVAFFGLLYRDERVLNAIEDRMDVAVSQLSAGQRILGGIDDPFLHVFAVTHMIDRACVGHCFSYSNYEPSTGYFRVRSAGENPYVVSKYDDSWHMQDGTYVVRDRDLPLAQLILDDGGRMIVRNLKAGGPCGRTTLKALPDLAGVL